MRENTIKSIWAQGKSAINGWLTMPGAWVAELMAHQPWDSLTIDMQHGLIDYQAAVGMLQAISTRPVIPMVRVPWNEPGIIMKMLDAGAYGVICPMTNTRAQTEAFVGACRYPPQGYRSYGPLRALVYAGSGYLEEANHTILALAMIETAQAVENVEEIASVPGLDGLYVGPSDLRISMGLDPAAPHTEKRIVDALDKVLAAARKYRIAACTHCNSVADARLMLDRGFRLVTVTSEARLLTEAVQSALSQVRGSPVAAREPAAGPY